MKSNFRKFLANAALVIASLVVCFLALEAGMRLYSGVPILSTANFVARALDIVRTNTSVMLFDEVLGWRLKDGFGAPGSGFTTTRLGIRNNAKEMTSIPKGAVLAVGDSFTAGSGVRDEQTWPAQLESLIGMPVVNGAAGAWGVDQMVLRAEKLAEEFKPSTILVGVLTQDSLRNSYEVYGGGFKPWFKVVEGKPVLQGVPVPRFEDSSAGLGWRRIAGHSWLLHWTAMSLGQSQRWISNDHRYRRVLSDKEGVEVSCALMQRLDQLSKQHGSKIVVVLLWGAQESSSPEEPWYGPPVAECARKAGFGVLDLYPVLHDLSQTDKTRFVRLWIDEGGVLGHPSAEGHALTARLLQELFFPDRRAK